MRSSLNSEKPQLSVNKLGNYQASNNQTENVSSYNPKLYADQRNIKYVGSNIRPQPNLLSSSNRNDLKQQISGSYLDPTSSILHQKTQLKNSAALGIHQDMSLLNSLGIGSNRYSVQIIPKTKEKEKEEDYSKNIKKLENEKREVKNSIPFETSKESNREGLSKDINVVHIFDKNKDETTS